MPPGGVREYVRTHPNHSAGPSPPAERPFRADGIDEKTCLESEPVYNQQAFLGSWTRNCLVRGLFCVPQATHRIGSVDRRRGKINESELGVKQALAPKPETAELGSARRLNDRLIWNTSFFIPTA